MFSLCSNKMYYQSYYMYGEFFYNFVFFFFRFIICFTFIAFFVLLSSLKVFLVPGILLHTNVLFLCVLLPVI